MGVGQSLRESRQRSRRLRSSLLQVVIGVAQEPVDAKHDLSDRRRRHLLLEQRLDEARRARFIAAARLFDIENVMTGFR